MRGHFNLGWCHVDVSLGNAETHDVGGVGAQLGSSEIERQAVLLQGCQDLLQRLEMMVPVLMVDDDAVDTN